MKAENIFKRLEKEGYNVNTMEWEYWDGITYIDDFAVAEYTASEMGDGINTEFRYQDVIDGYKEYLRNSADDDDYDSVYDMQDYFDKLERERRGY